MNRYSVLTAILSVAITASAFGADWTKLGLTVLEKKEGDGAYEYRLKDAGGQEFDIQSEKEVSDDTVQRALGLKTTLSGRELFKIKEIKFIILPNSIDAVIVPSFFTYKDTDILPCLPSTILFSLSDRLEYNFRIVKDNIFMRIKGDFSTDDELGEKVVGGIKNPLSFVRMRDPEVFLTRINEIEDANRKLRNAVISWHNTGFLGIGSGPIDQKKVDRVTALKRQKPDMKKDEVKAALEKEGISVSGKELSIIFSAYFNDFE
ncbi:MAG: hypothetical protein EPN93_00170 [Spirochaetes bacterium]|nr:MAG: hypothetical protein EPN93_00170 [Spirochaetota bacterium]